MNVPLLDLKAQYSSIKEEIDAAVADVFASQYFILGPKVKECEAAIAEYCQTPHAVGVSSGTDAILVALMAENIGPGDEVITTPYSFFATAGCIARTGAKPVFVDIEPTTFNIDSSKIEAVITDQTKAIMPVHLYGQMADMDSILQIAANRNLVVIEDAAQAIGSADKGARAGQRGHYGCFSFFPSKNLGGAGDGGVVVMNDKERHEQVSALRSHGAHVKYYNRWLGGNFRLDALQAAVISVKLSHLDRWTERRQQNADRYRELFSQRDLNDLVLPESKTDRHIYNQFIVRVPRRDELVENLKAQGIGVEIYYPLSLHQQECFSYLGHQQGDFPEAEKAAGETIALPIHENLNDEQLQFVVDSIEQFYRE